MENHHLSTRNGPFSICWITSGYTRTRLRSMHFFFQRAFYPSVQWTTCHNRLPNGFQLLPTWWIPSPCPCWVPKIKSASPRTAQWSSSPQDDLKIAKFWGNHQPVQYTVYVYIYIWIDYVHVLHNGVPLLFLIFKKWRNHHFPVSATAPDGANFGLSFSRWRQGFSRDLARLKLEIQATNNSIQLGYSWFMSS